MAETESLPPGQLTFPETRSRGRKVTRKTSSGKLKPPRQAGMVQFINTMHPDESISSQSLSLIRSHVAKRARAAQREEKQRRQNASAPLTKGLSVPTSIESDVADEEDEYDQRNVKVNGKFRKLVPKTHASQSPSTALARRRSPSPIMLLGSAQKDAFPKLAISLSEDEQYLFDFYLNYVISQGYRTCHHKEDESVFQSSMREVWVPYAIAHPSLMAAIFHVACRNYAATTDNSNSQKFSIKKLQYRLTCLHWAKKAIESQSVADDTTIALALIMASESYFEGDMNAFFMHGNGLIKMVNARGGLNALGMSGFLTKNVGWSIYTPDNYLVAGPNEVHPSEWQ